VNSKTRMLLEYWDFHGKSIDEAWCLLEWIAWDSLKFEKACCIFGYSFPDRSALYDRSCYAPFLVYMCSSSDHNITSCPFYACYAPLNSSFPLALGEPFRLLLGLMWLIHIVSRKILLIWCIIYLRLLWRSHVICICKRSLLASVVIMFSTIPLINPMFLLCVHNLLLL